MPENWKKYKLSEAFEIIGGGTPKTKVKEYWNGNIPWLSVVDFNNDQRTVFSTEKSITELGVTKSSAKILTKGQLIISARGTVGQIAQLGRDMAFNQSCYGLSGKENILINDFGYYLLKSSITNIQANSHGSVFDTITRNTFDNIDACIPEIEEQKSIASILSALDDKIELNLQMNKTLEEMAMALYKHWFVDFGPFQDGEFADSELGEIPTGWELSTFDEILILQRGFDLPQKMRVEGKYPVFAASGRSTSHIEKKVKGPGIVTGRSGVLGKVYLIQEDFWPLNTTLWVKNYLNSSPYHAYFLLLSMDLKEYNSGSAVPTLNRNDVHRQLMIKPPMDVINKFDQEVKFYFDLQQSNYIENITLTQLRDTLLPKLISGEVRVKDAEKTLSQVL
ncbi:restriction endonuclease subunit S [Salinimicrobium catena]|uniref:restriction endonuclease subunit S n=1 Tax=Salinimicrobium catena TaxID=390640 RepID=UPI002FE4B8BB